MSIKDAIIIRELQQRMAALEALVEQLVEGQAAATEVRGLRGGCTASDRPEIISIRAARRLAAYGARPSLPSCVGEGRLL